MAGSGSGGATSDGSALITSCVLKSTSETLRLFSLTTRENATELAGSAGMAMPTGRMPSPGVAPPGARLMKFCVPDPTRLSVPSALYWMRNTPSEPYPVT